MTNVLRLSVLIMLYVHLAQNYYETKECYHLNQWVFKIRRKLFNFFYSENHKELNFLSQWHLQG